MSVAVKRIYNPVWTEVRCN